MGNDYPPSRGYQRERKLFFFHIPKCGGSALRGAIEAQAGAGGVLVANDGALHCSDEIARGISRPGFFNRPEDIPETNILMGHMSFPSALSRFPDTQVFTLFRMPTVRLISHYIYWRGLSLENINDPYDKRLIAKSHQSLYEFLNDPGVAMQTDNLLTRLLIWPKNIRQEEFIPHEADNELLTHAVSAIEKLSFVEIYEHPRLTDQIEKWFGREMQLDQTNETPRLPESQRFDLHQQLTPSVFDLIAQRTRLDEILWMKVATRTFDAASVQELKSRVNASTFAKYAALCAPAV